MKKVITAPDAPSAIGPYSHAVQVGNILFTSGQIPLVPETGELIVGDIRVQTEQVLRNLEAVLRAADMNFSNVIKTTVFLTNLADFAAFNEVFATRFPENPPARSCVQVAALPRGCQVEIEVIASK